MKYTIVTAFTYFQVDDLLSLKCISRVTRCLYILALLAAKDFAYYGPKLVCKTNVKEKKTSVPGKMKYSISVSFTCHCIILLILQTCRI